ncbi:MAG: pyridoxal-dependent decarboxylase [Defluviitaleaceae bacterium]|nr:pyridoxal-dependent decarboxylase [Defluviitaleaceae bacterium]
MISNWHEELINNLDNSPYNNEEYGQFRPLFDFVFSELKNVLADLQNSGDETDRTRYQKYEGILSDWYGYVHRINSRKETHFGYPVNLTKRSFLVNFFRVMESFEVIQSNFGDIQEISDIDVNEHTKLVGNNYAMDVKSLEWDIVRLIADNFGLPKQPRLVELLQNPGLCKDGYWGYVTSGGSESNLWGIIQGFAEYPNGILYFGEGAHYSIPKAAKDRNYQIISQTSADDDSIDVTSLLDTVRDNWLNFQKPAILVLTVGTTKYGSVDNVALIKKQLRELQIPHYLHIDAAFYGGIPKNQNMAPKIGSVDEWGYDSIAISTHKYIGYPAAKGVLVSVKKPCGKFVDYVGLNDNTVLGSRTVHAFSLRQQVMEVMEHSCPQEYIQNVNTFANMLDSAGIGFKQWVSGDCKGNIFVFKANKDVLEYQSVCKKWQLSEFIGKDNIHRFHVIIFPYHSKDKLCMLVDDLSKIVLT